MNPVRCGNCKFLNENGKCEGDDEVTPKKLIDASKCDGFEFPTVKQGKKRKQITQKRNFERELDEEDEGLKKILEEIDKADVTKMFGRTELP